MRTAEEQQAPRRGWAEARFTEGDRRVRWPMLSHNPAGVGLTGCAIVPRTMLTTGWDKQATNGLDQIWLRNERDLLRYQRLNVRGLPHMAQRRRSPTPAAIACDLKQRRHRRVLCICFVGHRDCSHVSPSSNALNQNET